MVKCFNLSTTYIIPGAYTTTRSHNNASYILFWERHMKRLAQSVRILSNSSPQLLCESNKSTNILSSSLVASFPWESVVRTVVKDSMREAIPIALKERSDGEELAITTLVDVNLEKLSASENVVDVERVIQAFNVHIHIGTYVPRAFGVRGNGACLAVVGRGRDIAAAKYSDWVRCRKPLEKLRPPSVTELLLSNDGDEILEGCLTNFFVVSCKDNIEDKGNDKGNDESTCPFEVQTAAVSDGVLAGVIRQLVSEACLSNGILFREVAPSLSTKELWEEAFVTNSLRIMEHVETILVPSKWKSLHSKTLNDISWKENRFKDDPGTITTVIQKEIMKKAILEGYPINNFL